MKNPAEVLDSITGSMDVKGASQPIVCRTVQNLNSLAGMTHSATPQDSLAKHPFSSAIQGVDFLEGGGNV